MSRIKAVLRLAVHRLMSSSIWVLTGVCNLTARNQVRKSHEVLRQTGFESDFGGGWPWGQSGAHSKMPRVVRDR